MDIYSTSGNSDGTHSLQRIRWLASAAIQIFFHPFWWKNKLIYILDGLRMYTVGTESIQTPLNFSLFVILQPFAKII